MSGTRIVIIGGVAGGASAATRARRLAPVNLAGMIAQQVLRGDVRVVPWHDVAALDCEKTLLLDVRDDAGQQGYLPGSLHIPLLSSEHASMSCRRTVNSSPTTGLGRAPIAPAASSPNAVSRCAISPAPIAPGRWPSRTTLAKPKRCRPASALRRSPCLLTAVQQAFPISSSSCKLDKEEAMTASVPGLRGANCPIGAHAGDAWPGPARHMD